jgi:pimeloyl-ACP methyl ester carboxylesterase
MGRERRVAGSLRRQALEDMLPNAELEFIPDAGHFCMEDAPERVADSLTSFFTRAKDIM